MTDLLDQLDEELIQKRHQMEEHLQGALILMESLEDAADRAREEMFTLNPFTQADQIRERQILHAIVNKQLPRILENIMNAGDGEKAWRYYRSL